MADTKRALKKRNGGARKPSVKGSSSGRNPSASVSSAPRTPAKPAVTQHDEYAKATLQTPFSRSSTANSKPKVSGTQNIDLLQDAVEQELHGSVFYFDDSWVAHEFKDLATDEKVSDFLAKSPLFDSKARKWHGFLGATDEAVMYPLIQRIGNSVSQELGGASLTGPRLRRFLVRDRQRLDHIEAVPTTDYTMPDVVIEAAGPSFQIPPLRERKKGKRKPKAKSLGYTNISSFIEVKLSLNAPTARGSKLIKQMGVYARYGHSQCFCTNDSDSYSQASPHPAVYAAQSTSSSGHRRALHRLPF